MTAPRSITTHAAEESLQLDWPDGIQQLSYLRLRAACPCSACRAARLRGAIDTAPASVRVVGVNLQGYGVQLVFSDGHGRGVYPWAYLRGLQGYR